jgi:hypothetical protein
VFIGTWVSYDKCIKKRLTGVKYVFWWVDYEHMGCEGQAAHKFAIPLILASQEQLALGGLNL